jgi:hypothetical protein
MQKWEYHILILSKLQEPFTPQMNELGEQGWELVSSTVLQLHEGANLGPTQKVGIMLFFKRPK